MYIYICIYHSLHYIHDRYLLLHLWLVPYFMSGFSPAKNTGQLATHHGARPGPI